MYDKKKVETLKRRYPQGTRICVDSMENDPRPIPPGTKGTVDFVDDIGTFPDSFRMTQAGRLRPYSVHWMNWGMMSHGRCLTAQILKFPNPERECLLSDFLEENVPDGYCLSQTQIQRLLSKEFPVVKETEFTQSSD